MRGRRCRYCGIHGYPTDGGCRKRSAGDCDMISNYDYFHAEACEFEESSYLCSEVDCPEQGRCIIGVCADHYATENAVSDRRADNVSVGSDM